MMLMNLLVCAKFLSASRMAFKLQKLDKRLSKREAETNSSLIPTSCGAWVSTIEMSWSTMLYGSILSCLAINPIICSQNLVSPFPLNWSNICVLNIGRKWYSLFIVKDLFSSAFFRCGARLQIFAIGLSIWKMPLFSLFWHSESLKVTLPASPRSRSNH